MCGLAGWAFNQEPRGEHRGRLAVAAHILADAIDQRGGHGWGYATGTGLLERGVGLLAPAMDAYAVSGARVAILHARYATIGAKTVENSHPFRFGHITGAHNGGIWNHREIGARYGRDFPVDSMHIIAHIAEGAPLDELTGYGAVEFIDAHKDGAVGLFRFNNGDLAMGDVTSRDGKIRGVAWASTLRQLQTAMTAGGFVLHPRICVEGRVYYVFQGELYESDQHVNIGHHRPGTYGKTYALFDDGEPATEPDDEPEPEPVRPKVVKKISKRARKKAAKRAAILKPVAPQAGIVRYDAKKHQLYLDQAFAAANKASETKDS